MSEELLTKLLQYIDAAIDAKSEQARESSDGGLVESIVRHRVKDELFELLNKEDKQ